MEREREREDSVPEIIQDMCNLSTVGHRLYQYRTSRREGGKLPAEQYSAGVCLVAPYASSVPHTA
eukprot:337943-Rhodomonas_salina.1